jgi:hypothetical protein
MALKKKASIRRDERTQAVRSYFDAAPRKAAPARKAAAARAFADSPPNGDAFLEAHRAEFKLEDIELRRETVKEGAATTSVRYEQRHHGLPVHGAHLVVGLSKAGGDPVSVVNKIDYELPAALTADQARLTGQQADVAARAVLSDHFPEVVTSTPRLVVYRAEEAAVAEEPRNLSAEDSRRRRALYALGTGQPGRVYLAYRIEADTKDAQGRDRGHWEIFIDAVTGEVLAVTDRRQYVTRKAYVFWPDPITSSGDANLSWTSPVATLDSLRKRVDLENLNAPVGGKYALSGTWVTSVDRESPRVPPPTTTTDFEFSVKDRAFLSVMAYYWIDRFVVYLRGLGIATLNAAMTKPMPVDAQGVQGDDQSYFVVTGTGSYYLAFGEGGVPDASDPHVVVHEYGHAVHHFLGSRQGGYEEGFNDFMAAAWLDRFNTRRFQRFSVFPWDNCAAVNWDDKRRLDLEERFDDARFRTYGMYLKGDILATALWDLFLALGGKSTAAAKRRKAADTVIRTYLEMLITAADRSVAQDLANGLLVADQALNQGANKAAIKKAFRTRGLKV